MSLEKVVQQQSEQISQLMAMLSAQQNASQKGGAEMKFYVPKGCSFFQRKDDGRWVARIMIDGKQQPVACRRSKKYVYEQLMKAHRAKKKVRVKKDKEMRLFEWLDHWHAVFRKPKEGSELSKNTIIMDLSMIRKIKILFKNVKLKDLTADMVQQKLYSMTQGRTCEGVYTILKMAMSKAKDRTGGVSIMDMVEKVKHKRVRGRALKKDEVDTILRTLRNESEREIVRFYLLTGCRVSELPATKIEYVNLTNEPRILTGLMYKNQPVPDMTLLPNEIFIYGTKTRLSLRTMPIMPPLKPILKKLIKDKNESEKLFGSYTTEVIRNFHDILKVKLVENKTPIKFTLKDYRHTCATNFKDAGIPSSVYFRWFGWSDDTMARKVYTHETDYEKKLSQEWAEKFK